MNPRIQELEKQCWSHRVDGALVDGQLHFDTEKFAELIVGECMSIVDDEGCGEGGCIRAIEKIKKHFGVEE